MLHCHHLDAFLHCLYYTNQCCHFLLRFFSKFSQNTIEVPIRSNHCGSRVKSVLNLIWFKLMIKGWILVIIFPIYLDVTYCIISLRKGLAEYLFLTRHGVFILHVRVQWKVVTIHLVCLNLPARPGLGE